MNNSGEKPVTGSVATDQCGSLANDQAKIGILIASLIARLVGWTILRRCRAVSGSEA